MKILKRIGAKIDPSGTPKNKKPFLIFISAPINFLFSSAAF